MKVLLKVDIKKLGRKGDIVDVADGYAMSALIPSGQGEVASTVTVKQSDKQQVSKDRKDKEMYDAKKALARKLKQQTVEIEAKAEGETLFGSIGSAEVAQAIKEAYNEVIEDREVELPQHIKKLGEHNVVINLGQDVRTEITAHVIAS